MDPNWYVPPADYKEGQKFAVAASAAG
jgi:hypothetical protein